MSSEVRPPIIVNASGDVYFYRTVAEVELDLEVPDVRNGEYEVFDSHGRVLGLEVISSAIQDLVRVVSTERFDPEYLRDFMISFFTVAGENESGLRSMHLRELVDLGFRLSNRM